MCSTARDDLRLEDGRAAELARTFPDHRAGPISATRSPTATGTIGPEPDRPLSLFDGPRIDFSLARLRHYTGTPVEHTQRYVLFTNYVRYVDEFVRWAVEELKRDDSPYRGAVRAPAASSSPRTRPTPRRWWRRAAGGATRCPPIT